MVGPLGTSLGIYFHKEGSLKFLISCIRFLTKTNQLYFLVIHESTVLEPFQKYRLISSQPNASITDLENLASQSSPTTFPFKLELRILKVPFRIWLEKVQLHLIRNFYPQTHDSSMRIFTNVTKWVKSSVFHIIWSNLNAP